MKKTLIFVTLIMITILATGCSWEELSEDRLPGGMEKKYYQTRNDAGVALVNSNVIDIKAFEEEMDLVAHTIKRRSPAEVTFLYSDAESGEIYTLQTLKVFEWYMNKHELAELLEANMTLDVLELLEQRQAGAGNIVGAIMNWTEYDFFGHEIYRSVCDFNGDAVWDYCTEDTTKYNPIRWAGIASDPTVSRELNDQTVSLSSSPFYNDEEGIIEFQEDYLN